MGEREESGERGVGKREKTDQEQLHMLLCSSTVRMVWIMTITIKAVLTAVIRA